MKLMRQLNEEHKRLWDKVPTITAKMKATCDCAPELLSGWTDRDISLWDISEINGKPTLKDILIALCRKKKDWKKIGYLKFQKDIISAAGLNLTESNGNTGDQRVDTSRIHFEIKDITGKELCTLIFTLSSGKYEIGEFTKKELDNILFEIYDSSKTSRMSQGATSEVPSISLPTSGTEIRAASEELLSELSNSEMLNSDQVPKPGSSTQSD
jgi:hypothetical protein